jgi:hypothetical protein
MSLMFVGSAFFNLAYTLPNAPGSLQALVANAAVYREVIRVAVDWNMTSALTIAVIVFELATGLLILSRGAFARLALLAAGVWGLAMLPVIPSEGILIGVALTGAPGLAGLLLARRTYRDTVFAFVPSVLHPRPAN